MIPNNEQQKPMVENISCILPENDKLGGLYLGNVFGAQNADILKQYGIRAVITSSAQTKISYKFEDIPFHLRIQAHDKDDYYISEHINDCIHFIEQNRKFTNVYVHCYAGVSRSSAIVCAYIMWKYRWTLDKALTFLVFKRIVAKPNQGFYNQLKEIQIKLKIVGQNKPSVNKSYEENSYVKAAPHQISQNSQIIQQRPQSLQPTSNNDKPHSPPINQQVSNFDKPQLRMNQVVGPLQVIQQPMQPMQPMQQINVANRGALNQSYKTAQGNSTRVLQGRASIQQKGMYQAHQNHNEVPIPKILSRKSEYSNKNTFDEQINKKSNYNDYMSPQIQPTSPRYNFPPRGPTGKMNVAGSQFAHTSKTIYHTGNRQRYVESSIYSTQYQTGKKFESQQKTKTTSRCLIRPKDLPGYKNY